jgi:hypothetical protein
LVFEGGVFSQFEAAGGAMSNPNDSEVRNLLDSLGAEPLAGSGFEEEIPEPDFAEGEE